MKGDRCQFTEADYDFSDVKSKSELLACNWYEYARESREARAEIEAVRKQRQQFKGTLAPVNFGHRVQNLGQSHVLMMLSFTAGFPNLPWRHLSDKDKEFVLRMVAELPAVLHYAQTCHNPPLSFSLNELGTTTFDQWKQRCREHRPASSASEPIKYGFFAVNLKYARSVLIEDFTKYLRTFEGKAQLGIYTEVNKTVKAKPLGRKSFHDTLNALGAMRLRCHCGSFREAQKKMQALKDKPCGLFFQRRDNCNRACNSALVHFQQLFGWLDSAKPIHFTEHWRGGTQK